MSKWAKARVAAYVVIFAPLAIIWADTTMASLIALAIAAELFAPGPRRPR